MFCLSGHLILQTVNLSALERKLTTHIRHFSQRCDKLTPHTLRVLMFLFFFNAEPGSLTPHPSSPPHHPSSRRSPASMASVYPPPSSSQLNNTHNNRAVSFGANPPPRPQQQRPAADQRSPQSSQQPPHSLLRRPCRCPAPRWTSRRFLSRRIGPLLSMESARYSSSFGFVLFFFFLTGSWKARDCQTTWCAGGPMGVRLVGLARATVRLRDHGSSINVCDGEVVIFYSSASSGPLRDKLSQE